MSKMTVWHLDPGAFTLFYERPLLEHLIEIGVEAKLITSRSIHDAELQDPTSYEEQLYFRFLNRPPLNVLNRNSRTRRIARAVSYVFDQRHLTRKIRREKPDIIHVQWGLVPWLDQRVWRKWQAMGVRVVLTVHDLVPNHLPNEAAARYFHLYNGADALILHSPINYKELNEWSAQVTPDIHTGLMEKVSVIPMGALHQDLPNTTREEARTILGIPPNVPTLLILGNIRKYKGIPILLDAFRMVLQDVHDAYLVIAGYVTPDYPGGPEAIRDYAQGIPEENIKLDLYRIEHAQVPLYFIATDGVVLPYLYITQSAVALTALTIGRPIVASRVGGIQDVVIPDETGYLVEPGNVEELARSLVKLLQEDDKRQRMGDNAARLVREKFSWQPISEQTRRLYDQVLERS